MKLKMESLGEIFRRLPVGCSAIVISAGATTVGAAVCRTSGAFTQRKMILVDPITSRSRPVWVVTRTKLGD